jgi:LytS/YehU family sensor histidine kinase
MNRRIPPEEVYWMIVINPVIALVFGGIGYMYFTLRERFHSAVTQLSQKEIIEQRLVQLKTKAELEALRARVNPHFLFNTLNSIASLIPVDPARAETMVQELAAIFRYVLECGEREWVTLEEEMTIVRRYLDIEKVRLGERLRFNINIDDKVLGTQIPGLLLQPIVENSVKHAISRRQHGGDINVSCSMNGRDCIIEVKDTGEWIDSKESECGYGLRSVRERLNLSYGQNYEFEINKDDGVKITIKIPTCIP